MVEKNANLRSIDVLVKEKLSDNVTGAYFVQFANKSDNSVHKFIQASNDNDGSVKYYRTDDRKTKIPESADCKPRYVIEKDPASEHGIVGHVVVTASPLGTNNIATINKLKETFGYDYSRIEIGYAAIPAFGHDIRVTITYPKNLDGTCELSIKQMDYLLTEVEKAFPAKPEKMIRGPFGAPMSESAYGRLLEQDLVRNNIRLGGPS